MELLFIARGLNTDDVAIFNRGLWVDTEIANHFNGLKKLTNNLEIKTPTGVNYL
jgi:hypothetical protein